MNNTNYGQPAWINIGKAGTVVNGGRGWEGENDAKDGNAQYEIAVVGVIQDNHPKVYVNQNGVGFAIRSRKPPKQGMPNDAKIVLRCKFPLLDDYTDLFELSNQPKEERDIDCVVQDAIGDAIEATYNESRQYRRRNTNTPPYWMDGSLKIDIEIDYVAFMNKAGGILNLRRFGLVIALNPEQLKDAENAIDTKTLEEIVGKRQYRLRYDEEGVPTPEFDDRHISRTGVDYIVFTNNPEEKKAGWCCENLNGELTKVPIVYLSGVERQLVRVTAETEQPLKVRRVFLDRQMSSEQWQQAYDDVGIWPDKHVAMAANERIRERYKEKTKQPGRIKTWGDVGSSLLRTLEGVIRLVKQLFKK